MKQETRRFEGLSGNHHYTILNKRDLKELLDFGIVCTEIGREDSFYIVTEEEWNKNFVEENDETKK